MERSSRSELARADRILPGVWRIRLPLPWPGVPHVNAFALAADGGIVLFDTGIAGNDGRRQLELGLAQAGFELADVRLVVCTHAHTDHYGLAGTIVDETGCELWMHPAWEHIRGLADDPDAALERRLEIARQSGIPATVLERYRESRRGRDSGISRVIGPDRELVAGVEVETELGAWEVHETPGHAPSHVVLHQPERRLMITGDHLLGRVSLFFDHGHTPDPVAEFLAGLDRVEGLETELCLAGHGRPFRGLAAKVAANRAEVGDHLARVGDALADGEPHTAFEVAAAVIGPENLNPASVALGLQLSLSYLDHLVLAGGAIELDPDGDARRWRAG